MFEAKFGRRGILYRAVRLAERCTLALADAVMATNESVLSTVKKRGRKKEEEVFIVLEGDAMLVVDGADHPAPAGTFARLDPEGRMFGHVIERPTD